MTKPVLLACGLAILLGACSKSHSSPNLTGKWQMVGACTLGGAYTPISNGKEILELKFTGMYLSAIEFSEGYASVFAKVL